MPDEGLRSGLFESQFLEPPECTVEVPLRSLSLNERRYPTYGGVELGLEDKEMTIVVHDREDVTLEYIEKGIIDATVEAKTAYGPYLAIQLLENYHDRKMENDVPISADNWDAGIRSFPQFIYVGSVIIDQDNVQHLLRENLPEY